MSKETTFILTAEQTQEALVFERYHECKIRQHHGAIGGAITVQFTNTGIGQVQQVVCACGEKVDLTDYDDW